MENVERQSSLNWLKLLDKKNPTTQRFYSTYVYRMLCYIFLTVNATYSRSQSHAFCFPAANFSKRTRLLVFIFTVILRNRQRQCCNVYLNQSICHHTKKHKHDVSSTNKKRPEDSSHEFNLHTLQPTLGQLRLQSHEPTLNWNIMSEPHEHQRKTHSW
jgi:hypothetical protein